jgi:hypothetical protein
MSFSHCPENERPGAPAESAIPSAAAPGAPNRSARRQSKKQRGYLSLARSKVREFDTYPLTESRVITSFVCLTVESGVLLALKAPS